ncbi:MAG: hypothetical protein WDN46_01435 [Methylocella sp.]
MKRKRLQYSGSSAAWAALLAVLACAGLCLYPQSLQAETVSPQEPQQQAPKTPAPAAKAAPKKTAGTPLDTIKNTRIWADVPEARDFVRQSRTPTDKLDYQPTTGTDPQRPKLRTKAELEALQTELEDALAHNGARTGQRTAPKSPQAAATDAAKKAKPDKGAAN